MDSEKQERIRRRAYEIWQEKGCPDGAADEHWYQARRESDAETSPANETDNAAPTAEKMPRKRPAAKKPAAAKLRDAKPKPAKPRERAKS